MTELRFTKDGIPIYDGSAELYIPYRRAALNYVETLEWKKRPLAGPRLQAALEGSARIAVQHKPPGWISHEGGATQLLDLLKGKVQAPSLAEAGKTISRFFYQVKRRKGESMNSWIVRHDEALYEARRTLAEAIQEYAPGQQGESSSTREWTWQSRTPPAAVSGGGSRRDDSPRSAADEVFDDNGRLHDGMPTRHHDEADDYDDHAWTDDWWNQDQWWNWNRDRGHQSWWTPPENPPSLKYGVSSKATIEADKFLPDFVVAWMLLQRSNLDGMERSAIISSLKNQFTTERVKDALRLNWPEDDLRRRDQGRGSAMIAEEFEEAYFQDDDAEDPPDDFDDEEKKEYVHLAREAEYAHQAIQHHRKTLREAREKQSMMRKSRHFYPVKKESVTRWKSDKEVKCFRCGGAHLSADCPQKDKSNHRSATAHLGQEVHFTFVTEPEATVFSTATVPEDGHALSLHTLVEAGKAIIDGGATASVGSIDALDKVQALNHAQGQPREMSVSFGQCPSFRFGNNGKTQCLSTAQVEVPLADKTGTMKIHVHDIPQQPVLLSISALRSLGAVIDFSEDTCIFKKIDPCRVVKLERAESGHQVFPLTQDIFQNSDRRDKAFVSLKDVNHE